MKNLILILSLVASLYSCNEETDDIATKLDYTGKWELVKMSGNTGSETTGSDMEWQEYYILSEDETFTKTRVRGDSTVTVSGTYTISDPRSYALPESSLNFLELNHDSKNNILASCHSNLSIEHLYFSTDNRLISLYEQCDGPGLEYIKSK